MTDMSSSSSSSSMMMMYTNTNNADANYPSSSFQTGGGMTPPAPASSSSSSSSIIMARDTNNQAARLIQWGRYTDALPLLSQSLRLAKMEVKRLQQNLVVMEGGRNNEQQHNTTPAPPLPRRQRISYSFLTNNVVHHYPPSSSRCYQQEQEDNEDRSSTNTYIFQSPIIIHGGNTSDHHHHQEEQGEYSIHVDTEIIIFCIMFNLALLKHINATATATPPSPTGGGPPVRMIPSSSQMIYSYREYNLKAALQLYELAYQLMSNHINNNNDNNNVDDDDDHYYSNNMIGMVAILNNVSMIHQELGQLELYKRCREQLSQTIMFLMVTYTSSSASVTLSAVSVSSPLHQLFENILPTILGKGEGDTMIVAPAA